MPGAAGASPPIRVVVVDDHALFRRGIELVLAEDPGIEIVGEAENGVEAIEAADRLEPDVMLMDVRMPEASGIEATRAVRAAHPDVKVIMLTVSDEERDLIESVKAGANGYLLKELAIEEVPDAIRAVAEGQSLISPSMATKLLVEFNALARRADDRSVSAAPRLTERELEVLRHVAEGQSNRRIGEDLFIAENTVKNHVRNILEKLHLHSRTEAVAYAIREKLLDLDDPH